MAVLAKVLLDEVKPISLLCPNIPAPLSGLLSHMLDKDPARRPADAAALHKELLALPYALPDEGQAAPRAPAPVPVAATPSFDAMQLLSVVLAAPPAALLQSEAYLDAKDDLPPSFRQDLGARLLQLGGRAEWLADGALAIVVPPAPSAVDQAAVAARCALVVKEHWPEAQVAMAMGRGHFRGRLTVGAAIDSTASLLRQRTSAAAAAAAADFQRLAGGVWLDELSTKLLESRFSMTLVDGHPCLSGERPGGEGARLLLGQKAPCAGRELELSMMLGALDTCIDSSAASGMLILAPPGVGKSRLKHEFLARLRDRSVPAMVLSGSAAPLSAGSPYGILREALWQLCALQAESGPWFLEEKLKRRVAERVPPADAPRVGEFLAVLSGIPIAEPSVMLRAALSDPKLMSEQIRRAFVDFLRAETSSVPCILLLEDLHWSDAGTIKLIDAALLELAEQPLFVLAFARPEVTDLFPRLWEQRPVLQFRLGPLSRKAAERLVFSALGIATDAATRNRIVEHAHGNALFLEELFASSRIAPFPSLLGCFL